MEFMQGNVTASCLHLLGILSVTRLKHMFELEWGRQHGAADGPIYGEHC